MTGGIEHGQYHPDWIWIGMIIIGILWAGLLWFIKRLVNRWDEWKKGLDEKGGVVTRNDHFEWCGNSQNKCLGDVNCKFEEIFNWRNGIMEKGGPMTLSDHMMVCEKVSEKAAAAYAKRVDENYAHHREWVANQLELVRANLEKKLTEGFLQMSKEINHRSGGSK